MSHPFSRMAEDQRSGVESLIPGGGAARDGGSGIGNGVGTGVGAGMQAWWGNSRGVRGNTNEIVPKPTSQENEMVTVSSNFAGLSPVIMPGLYNILATDSPIPPRPRSNSVTSLPRLPQDLQNSQLLERPQPTILGRETPEVSDPVMQEMGQVAQAPLDIEAQQPVAAEMGKWWQKGSLKGLQSKFITVLVAGGFLAITLAIYLGLALTNDLRLRHEWHVLLILIILIATMFFCHALVRLCILATNPGRLQRSPSRNLSRIPSTSGPDGYANPREPIRIQTTFDHDVNGIGPDVTKLPPPVYGLWRCSVRVNPNQFYWVRRASIQQSVIPEGGEPTSPNSQSTPRPPSYVSEDGVSYALSVVNVPPTARPQPPLQPHSLEVQWLQNR